MKLSVIIPAHNEEDCIVNLINKIMDIGINAPHELIVVDDHSTDATAKLVKELSARHENIKLVENIQEPGFANALKTGFSAATSEAVLPVMADLCDDLSTVEKMLVKINDGYDVVCGSRYMKGGFRIGGSKLKAFLSCWGGKTLCYLLRLPTHDIANAFKMYRREVIDNITIDSKGFEISMEIPLKAYYSGFKITEVPTTWRERTKGKSNFRIFNLLPAYIKLYLWAIFK